ncbi:MAG: T9SS type A sorting domain-containing protein [Fibrobacterota bacterium]
MTERAWIEGLRNVALISGGGPGEAVIFGHNIPIGTELIVFSGCDSLLIEGLEIRNSGDNILKLGGCTNSTIKNCYIHGAAGQGDCIKITRFNGSFSENITVSGCILHSPGLNSGSAGAEFEECLDFMYTRNALVEDCWFFHLDSSSGNQLSYPKGDCEDIVYNRCLFGPQSTIAWDPAVGGGAAANETDYNVWRQCVKNSVFIECHGGALGSFGTKDYYIYNNLFFDCAERTRLSPSVLGIIHVKSDQNSENNDGFHIFNNIFYNSVFVPSYVMARQAGNVSGVNHDNNAFYNAGRNYFPSAEFDPSDESAAVFESAYANTSPAFPKPDTSVHNTWKKLDSLRGSIIASLVPDNGFSGISAGADASSIPYPSVETDINGNVRDGNLWDIGPYGDHKNFIENSYYKEPEIEITAFPNPFNSFLRLNVKGIFGVLRQVRPEIRDLSGKLVAVLSQEKTEGGQSSFNWDAGNYPSGVFYVDIKSSDFKISKKVVLIR